MKDKLQNLLIKLKLDKHHKIERFGVLFFSLTFTMIILFAIAGFKHIQNQKIILTGQAVYTHNAAWSLTGQDVNVVNVYRNTDCTKAFILIKTDVSKLSIDANDYQMLMTGYQGEPLANKNAIGAYYVFGNTGYMGLYFADASGFESTIYDIVVRNTNVITSDRVQNGEGDESFKSKNQIRIMANLAGKDAPIADFLEKDNPELVDIYAEVISVNEETEIRNSLNQSLIDMNNQMSIINEKGNFLKQMNIVVPSLPVAIANDCITDDATATDANPTQFDVAMYDEKGKKISNTYENVSIDTSTASDGVQVYTDSDKLYLVTDFVFPGGLQYNYQDMKLTDHYVTNNILPEGMNFKKFESEKLSEMSNYASYSENLSNKYEKWYMIDENGDTVRWTYSEGYAEDSAIQLAISEYTAAVQLLYDTKRTYQTQYLKQLAKIEASAETTVNLFSINTNTDGNASVLIIYE